MGTNYSQPPKGYQYSTQHFERETETLDVEPEYRTFHSLYQSNYANEKNLPYLLRLENDEIKSYSYDECYNFSLGIISFLSQHQLKASSTIVIYSDSSFESQIVFNAALMFGYHLLLSSPSSLPIDKFCDLLKSHTAFAIFCSSKDAPTISKLFQAHPVIITDTDSKYNSFWKIINGSKKSFANPVDRDEDFEAITYLTNSDPISLTNSEMFKFITSWSEKLKICRDAAIASKLPCDDNVFRLINFLCVKNRAKLCFPFNLNDVEKFDATHFFMSPNLVTQEIQAVNRDIQQDRSFLFRAVYSFGYAWKRVWVSMGSQSRKFEKSVFEKLRANLGGDLHYAFCSGQIPREIHEAWIVIYGIPLCSVFCPAVWGNVGASMPCDMRFIKIGTLGGPVENSVKIDEESNRVGSRVNGVLLDKNGFWDEEGALVITDI